MDNEFVTVTVRKSDFEKCNADLNRLEAENKRLCEMIKQMSIPHLTNPNATCVILEGDKPPEEVMFIGPDGVTHYHPE